MPSSTAPLPQTPRKKRSASIANENNGPEHEIERPAAKNRKTSEGKKQTTAKAPKEKKTPAPKPKVGKLAKLFKAHQRAPVPKPAKVNLKSRNTAATQKVSIGASFDSTLDPWKHRKIIEDAKAVDQKMAKEKERASPKPQIEICTDDNDPEVEIISCPGSVRWVRITNQMHNAGGERARMSQIHSNPGHYPHITIDEGKDDQGRTVVRRRKIEPEMLEELRAAQQEREKLASRAAGSLKPPRDKSAIVRARAIITGRWNTA